MKKQRLGQPDPFRVILRAYGEEHECELMPTGWAENSASWEFDPGTFGFNLKYSTKDLQFVKSDADFIRKQLDKYGISAEIDVIVQKCQNNWTYKDHFTAQIDFSTGYTNDRDFIMVGLYDGGLKSSVAINRRTNYDIGFDDTAVDLEVPEGMALHDEVNYDMIGAVGMKIDGKFIRSYNNMVLDTNTSSVKTESVKFNTQKWKDYDEDDNIIYPDIPFLITKRVSSDDDTDTSTIPANFSINLKYTPPKPNERGDRLDKNKEIVFYIEEKAITSSGSTTLRTAVKTLPAGFLNGSNPVEINIKTIIQIKIAENITYEYRFYTEHYVLTESSGVEGIPIRLFGTSVIDYNGLVNTGSFSLKAYKYSDFGNKLLDRVYAGANYKNTILDALEANNMQLFITTSDAIRGLETALIKTNLQDFEESFRCLFSSALKVNNNTNVYEICRKRDVFNPTNSLLNLGEVKELQIEQMPDDWEFNVFRYGYEKQEYDYPLGRQEFAATLEYLSGLRVPSTKKQEAICKYRADYTGVHLIRYDYVNNEKKDSKSDNDIFVILAFKDATTGKWQAVPGPGVTVGGLEGGGYFNILLSPHRNLRRNADYIRSILDKVSPILTYVSGTETQSNIVSTYNGASITEKTDEDMSGATRLFRPMVVKCTTVVPDNLPELLGENPAGYFEFTWNQLKWKGFPIKVESLSSYKSAQQVYMVMHPDTPDDVQFKMFWRDPSKLYM